MVVSSVEKPNTSHTIKPVIKLYFIRLGEQNSYAIIVGHGQSIVALLKFMGADGQSHKVALSPACFHQKNVNNFDFQMTYTEEYGPCK